MTLSPAEAASLVEKEIRSFARRSRLNRLPLPGGGVIFDEPLVQFARGDDPVFAEYKSIIGPFHLTPREALARAYKKKPEDLPPRLSVISWILPITDKTRRSNRRRQATPSRAWAYTRWYGEKFNDVLREHVVNFLTGKGYLAAAPMRQPYFHAEIGENGNYSNWSERHMAYAAGLGTFSLSDGFISERGIAHRCGSVVTDLELPPSPRIAQSPYANCLFYVNQTCRACIGRCPGEAISQKGHDKLKCVRYMEGNDPELKKKYGVGIVGCGLCQTKVPCEFINPARKLKKLA